ncbi:hypothetical protein PAMC26577_40055 [Caballeronia sordidicola]|uniref:Uncharacterized protein n=1 Tax=Caballeronia sordidicola TaxID=196367 RepID=A0A242M2U6_CABSO|nr:hypothetical protein PAMC26577_40055 [Caballeronia sordidicola]
MYGQHRRRIGGRDDWTWHRFRKTGRCLMVNPERGASGQLRRGVVPQDTRLSCGSP